MNTYWNSVQTSLEALNQSVTRALIKFYPQEQASKIYDRFHTASMSHNRLKALVGTKDRQCDLDKLMTDATNNEASVKWNKSGKGEGAKAETPELNEDKIRRELWRAQHRQSQVRLQAFVSTLSDKERADNEREGRRLNPGWELPKAN